MLLTVIQQVEKGQRGVKEPKWLPIPKVTSSQEIQTHLYGDAQNHQGISFTIMKPGLFPDPRVLCRMHLTEPSIISS